MASIPYRRALATLSVAAALLVAAAPAGAQHVSDGTSNTVMFWMPEVGDEVQARGIIAVLIGAKAAPAPRVA